MAERVVVVCDLCGDPAARSVTFKIANRRLAQDLCPSHFDDLLSHSHAPKRGRRPNLAAPASGPKGAAGGGGARRARRARKTSAAKRPRRRVTDPSVLEKRRASLEKARQALAKKRAAAKKAS